MKQLAILSILFLCTFCGTKTTQSSQDSHVNMPEKDKDGERSEEKAKFDSVLESLGKSFIEKPTLSNPDLLNQKQSEQEQAIESDFIVPSHSTPVAYLEDLLFELVPYDAVQKDLPSLEKQIKQEIANYSKVQKEVIMEALLYNLSLIEENPAYTGKKFDLRLACWFMRFFTSEANTPSVSQLYRFILIRGDLKTFLYMAEKNFSDPHAIDLGPILDFFHSCFADLAKLEKTAFPREMVERLRDLFKKYGGNVELNLTEEHKKERQENADIKAIQNLIQRLHEDNSAESLRDIFSKSLELGLEKLTTSLVSNFYSVLFFASPMQARLEILEHLVRIPHKVDFYTENLFGQIRHFTEEFSPSLSRSEKEKLLKSISEAEHLAKVRSEALQEQEYRENKKKLEEQMGMTQEEDMYLQEERRKEISAMQEAAGMGPIAISLEEAGFSINENLKKSYAQWRKDRNLPDHPTLKSRLDSQNSGGNEELKEVLSLVEEFKSVYPRFAKEGEYLNLDLLPQVRQFLGTQHSAAEKQAFYEAAIQYGSKKTINLILLANFGLSLKDIKYSADEVKEFAVGKTLPEDLKGLKEAPQTKRKTLEDLKLRSATDLPQFYDSFRKLTEKKSKDGFNCVPLLQELVPFRNNLDSNGHRSVAQIIRQAIQVGDQQTVSYLAQKLSVDIIHSENAKVDLLMQAVNLGQDAVVRRVLQ